jgi:hypothetical protein
MNSVRLGRLAFPPAVFLGAFLLFQVQPLLGKLVLPWYGGSPAVWTTCLVVFQSLLFAGYAYVHGIQRLPVRAQAAIHVALLLVAATISIVPSAAWKPAGGESPLLRIVLMLAATAGVPYLALAATGPLLQAWSWRAGPGPSPYPLYALSNAGSLLALVSYPFVVEPLLGLGRQAAVWRGGFAAFVALCVVAAATAGSAGGRPRRDAVLPAEGRGESALPDRARRLLWVGWSACGVILFMAVTNQLTLNVAAVPFLWVLPLSIYLLTFIVAFSGRRAYPRGPFAFLLVVASFALWLAVQIEIRSAGGGSTKLSIVQQIAVYGAALFVLCLVCHGELYRLRPEPARLTGFYLAIAGGGALGGIVVAVVAPLAFLLYQELHAGVLLCGVLVLATRWADPADRLHGARPRWAAGLAALGLAALACMFSLQTWTLLQDARTTRRNFFGVLRVQEVGRDHPAAHALRLWHGATVHGYQFLSPEMQRVPAGYYMPATGIGAALGLYRPEGGRRLGIVGLGAGTLAAWGRAGDTLRFYEIDPDVVELATTDFSYLARCAARWEIAVGDARLSLEREENQRFDLLILDAFSSDSIPVHLLTREAFAVYDRHLVSRGVIAVHVSNRHLDLPRVVHPIAAALGFQSMEIHTRANLEQLTLATSWMILSRDGSFLQRLADALAPQRAAGDVLVGTRASADGASLWTDDHSNPFGILK